MLTDSVRQFKKADFPKLAEFVKKHFHGKYILTDQAFFEWQYRNNPCIEDCIFFLLEQNAELFGYIGLVPLDYKIGNQTIRLNVYANLFVDERARGFGLGTLLIKKAMAAGSPAMISGYTPQSFPIYQKLGDWRALGNFYRYIYIFNQDSVKKLIPDGIKKDADLNLFGDQLLNAPEAHRQVQHYEAVSLKPIKAFDYTFDEFWKHTRNRYAVTVERTSAYLNWRYANHPCLSYEMRLAEKDGQIFGYVIYRIERTAGFAIARIVDFVSQEREEADILRAFIAEVKDHVDMVDFMFSGQYGHGTLKQLGFFDVYGTPLEHLPIHFNPVSYAKNYINFCTWQNGEPIDKNIFYNYNSWYLTRGDGDQDRPNPH